MDNLSRRLVSAQQSEAGSAAETEPVTAQRSGDGWKIGILSITIVILI